jgi:hypothetical protein
MTKIYKVGAVSPKLGRTEWICCTDEFPLGRITMDEQVAMVWANEFVELCNTSPESGCTEWTPTVWYDDLPDWINSSNNIE